MATNPTPTEQCAHLHSEDAAYGTDPLSPLHHDNRCPLHGRGPLGPNPPSDSNLDLV